MLVSEETLGANGLPVDYDSLSQKQRVGVRETYAMLQNNQCAYCGGSLWLPPPQDITEKTINLMLYPDGFLDSPVHLHHDHDTGLTRGAVHAYCNAVLWEYEGE